jgi:hypothetical protein
MTYSMPCQNLRFLVTVGVYTTFVG